MTFTKQTVLLAHRETKDRTISVEGWVEEHGLLAYHGATHDDGQIGPAFAVTHVASGLCVCTGLESETEAVDAVAKLIAAGQDFFAAIPQDYAEAQKLQHPQRAEVKRIAYEVMGWGLPA